MSDKGDDTKTGLVDASGSPLNRVESADATSATVSDTSFKANAEVLPSSVAREIKNFKIHNGIPWIPIFCANCGKDGGWIPEETKDFAFYICESPCGEKWDPIIGTYVVPDEVFWEHAKQVQLEKYGRELQPYEVVEALKDGNHILSKLAKDRHKKKK